MIHVYGKNGNMSKVKQLYQQLKNDLFLQKGSCTTYTVLINACSHCGDINQADLIWRDEIIADDIKFNEYIITSLVDCFAKHGKVKM